MYVLVQAAYTSSMNNSLSMKSNFGQLSVNIDVYDTYCSDFPEHAASYLKGLEEKIGNMGTVSQQDMTDAVVYSLAHTLAPNITQKLLIMWHDKININLIPQKQNGLIPRPLFNEIICKYGKSLYMDPPTKNPTDSLYHKEYESLYLHMCDNFKNELHVNVKHDHQTPFFLTCKRFISHQQRSLSFNGPEKNLGTFLETFIARFHHDIDFFTRNEDNKDVFDLCEMKDGDEPAAKQNKAALLSLLKKYCLDKSITKKGLSKAHNCHFLFAKNLD